MIKKLYIALFALLLFSCKKEQLNDCFTSTGADVTITRELETFSGIDFTSKFTVILAQDTSKPRSVTLTGGENVLPGIHTTINAQGILRIENANTCNFVRSYKRDITVKINVHDLSFLDIKSAVNIVCQDTINVKNIRIFHSALEDVDLKLNATGEIYIESLNSAGTILRGRAKVLKGSIQEVSNLDARHLKCEEVIIDSHTPKDMYVDASRVIYVKIYRAGNIYYLAEPSDLKEVKVSEGAGKLLKLQ